MDEMQIPDSTKLVQQILLPLPNPHLIYIVRISAGERLHGKNMHLLRSETK